MAAINTMNSVYATKLFCSFTVFSRSDVSTDRPEHCQGVLDTGIALDHVNRECTEYCRNYKTKGIPLRHGRVCGIIPGS